MIFVPFPMEVAMEKIGVIFLGLLALGFGLIAALDQSGQAGAFLEDLAAEWWFNPTGAALFLFFLVSKMIEKNVIITIVLIVFTWTFVYVMLAAIPAADLSDESLTGNLMEIIIHLLGRREIHAFLAVHLGSWFVYLISK